MNKFLIGSKYFFAGYADFVGGDLDELQLIDTTEFKQIRQITRPGCCCLFQVKRHDSVDEYIAWALKQSNGMVIGKFLVPEFCSEIGFTISDLKRLEPLLARLDSKHRYEEIIYNSYLENGDFFLTEAQRDLAYKSYKESRGCFDNGH